MRRHDKLSGWDVAITMVRAVFWILIVVAMATLGRSDNPAKRAVVFGFLYADLITWGVITLLVELPRSLVTPAWETLFNVVLVVIVLRVYGVEVPRGNNAEAYGFLVFLATLAFKSLFYTLRYVSEDFSDDA